MLYPLMLISWYSANITLPHIIILLHVSVARMEAALLSEPTYTNDCIRLLLQYWN